MVLTVVFDGKFQLFIVDIQFQRSPLWNKIPLIRQALALKFDLVSKNSGL